MLSCKLLTKSLLISSVLISLSPAYAMEKEDLGSLEKDRWGNVSIKVSLLKKGYELGKTGKYLELTDGTQYLVTKNSGSSEPSFPLYPNTVGCIHLQEDLLNSSYGEGTPSSMQWNEETQQWEGDSMGGGGFVEYFNLSLTRIKKEERVEESTTASSSTTSNLISQQKKEESAQESTTASSSTASNLISQIKEETFKKNNTNSKIFKELSQLENEPEKTFYTEKDPQKDLYYGIELLTPDNEEWWRQRLGAEAHMLFGQEVEFERLREMEMTDAERTTQAESARAWTAAVSPGQDTSGPQEFETPEPTFVDMFPYYNYYNTQYGELYRNNTGSFGDRNDYLGAWRAFKYNLDHYAENSTWVTYVCSTPIEKPLYQYMPVTTSEIKMSLTLKISNTFFGCEGISSSVIAKAHAQATGEPPHTQLCVPFFSAIARFVKEINPKTKALIFRPLESIKRAAKKGGLIFSESSIEAQNLTIPYVRFAKSWYGGNGEIFGDSPYLFIDPRSDEVCQIDGKHWFSRDPFLGGVQPGKIVQFPIITMDIETLANFSQ